MTDILAALNFGFGFGWLALIVLLLIHLNRRLRFDQHEWTAVKLLIAIGIPSAHAVAGGQRPTHLDLCGSYHESVFGGAGGMGSGGLDAGYFLAWTYEKEIRGRVNPGKGVPRTQNNREDIVRGLSGYTRWT
jgi:hypothetical protein